MIFWTLWATWQLKTVKEWACIFGTRLLCLLYLDKQPLELVNWETSQYIWQGISVPEKHVHCKTNWESTDILSCLRILTYCQWSRCKYWHTLFKILSIVIIGNALVGEKNPKLMDASTGMGGGWWTMGQREDNNAAKRDQDIYCWEEHICFKFCKTRPGHKLQTGSCQFWSVGLLRTRPEDSFTL